MRNLKKANERIDAKKNRKDASWESKVPRDPWRDYVEMEDVGEILTIGSTPSPSGSSAGIARMIGRHMYKVGNITCDFYRSRAY